MADLGENIQRFYVFIEERERIRRRRLAGMPREEWTSDPIFQTYSFTNVKRHHDRTTIGLMSLYQRAWPYGYLMGLKRGEPPSLPVPEKLKSALDQVLLNATLYRFFGTVGMAEAIGWLENWDETQRERICKLAEDRDLLGREVFTSAYIVPAGGVSAPKREIVCDVARLLWHSLGDLEHSPIKTDSWEVMAYRLQKIWGFGPFMAKEVMLDYYQVTQLYPKDWQTWTPVGPGAIRGATRIWYGYLHEPRLNQDEALSVCQTIHGWREKYWPPGFDDVKLDLTDIQFQLCEFDKYMRVVDGYGKKPKRKFRPTIDEVTCGNR